MALTTRGASSAPTAHDRTGGRRKDAEVFTARTARLIKEFSGFEALPGLKVNGANTIGENIGDLGGLNMAHEAYLISLKGQPAPVHRRPHRRPALLPGLRAGVARRSTATARCASW